MGATFLIDPGGCWSGHPPTESYRGHSASEALSTSSPNGHGKYEEWGDRTASPRVETEGGMGAEIIKQKTTTNKTKINKKQSDKECGARPTACKGVMIPAGTGIRDRVTIHAISRPLARPAKYAADRGKIRRSEEQRNPQRASNK